MFITVIRNAEVRRVLREVRGFSRAQTGDTLTAVLPLTWSLTMLAHANTFSSNFDENTNATIFSFSIMAYQWGWNYYFPREVINAMSTAPRMVGHGHLVTPNSAEVYSVLLATARADYLVHLAGVDTLGSQLGYNSVVAAPSLLLPASFDGCSSLSSMAVVEPELAVVAAEEACLQETALVVGSRVGVSTSPVTLAGVVLAQLNAGVKVG
jgi:hypothetical protein